MRGHDQAEHPSRAGRERSCRQLQPLPRITGIGIASVPSTSSAWRGDRARQRGCGDTVGLQFQRDKVVAKDRPTTPKCAQRDSGFPRTAGPNTRDAAFADRQCCGVKYMSITPGQELRHRE